MHLENVKEDEEEVDLDLKVTQNATKGRKKKVS